MLQHVTPILVTTPTFEDLINKIALEGCPVEEGAPYLRGRFHCTKMVTKAYQGLYRLTLNCVILFFVFFVFFCIEKKKS